VRPRSIVRLNASRFGALLCARFAGQLERTWHDRAAYVGPTDIHDALDWWDDEENCWALLGELARNHRHWQTRLKVLMEMQTFGARWGRPAFRIPHPRYEDRPIEGEPAAVERAARQETHHGDVRMRSLARTLTVAGSPTVSGFQEVKDYLFELDLVGGALKKGTRKKLADNRAGAWGSIRQTFTERQSETEQLNLLFEERFAEMAGSLEEILPL
jgi:hypothetical protein